MGTKRIITNCLLILFPIMILVFLSQPYLDTTTKLLTMGVQSGYGMVDFYINDASVCNAICVVITSIFACLLILLTIYVFLRSIGVIKFKGLDSAMLWLKMIFVIIIFLSAVISIISLAFITISKDGVELYKIGWAAFVNVGISSLIVLTYLIERIKIKKKVMEPELVKTTTKKK